MKHEKIKPIIKWILYSLLLIVFYALQTTPLFLQILGIRPILLVGFTVCIAMHEDIIPSAIFGMMAGLLWDISADFLFGFNGLILLVESAAIALLTIYFFRNKILNSLFFCAAVIAIQQLLYFIFYYMIWNMHGALEILLKNILPTCIYTIAITPLFYLLVGFIHKKLLKKEQDDLYKI